MIRWILLKLVGIFLPSLISKAVSPGQQATSNIALNVEFKILDNGITIINDQINVESASIGVWIGAGSSNENNDECGIAHMLEHMAFKGTKNRNAETIAREIEDVGGDINAYTSKEVTAYFLKVLKENAELGVDILSDIIKNSTFPKDEIERERGVIISEIGQSYDAPDDRVFENFTKTAFKNQPMGRPILGTKETVSNFKQSDLKFFRINLGLYQLKKLHWLNDVLLMKLYHCLQANQLLSFL